MPFYEYRCDKCGHEFEEMQRITDPPIRKCPKCGKKSVERLISRTSFVLKGSGWYVTDYGRSGASSPPSSDSGNGKGNGSSETKTEAGGGDSKAESKPSETKSSESKSAASS